MGLFRGIDEPDGARSTPDTPVGHEHIEKATRGGTLARGTLACARCDAPVALARDTVAPSDPLSCPFCLHTAPVREFLTLGEPTRPAHVAVRISTRRLARAALKSRERPSWGATDP